MRRTGKSLFTILSSAALAAAIFIAGTGSARADLVISIDKSSQRMTVERDGATKHVFAVSTGRRPYGTPNGTFRPQRLERKWYSRKYDNAPMPYAIFFHGGYAIHGTTAIRALGAPASHGCVRLAPANAATVFAMVQREGVGRTRIVIAN